MPAESKRLPNSEHWLAHARKLGRSLNRHSRILLGKLQAKKTGALTGNPAEDVVSLLPIIEKSQASLLDFGKETDTEFTELAQGLSELNGRFSSIREQSETLDNLLHQRDTDNVLKTAYRVYKSSIDLVHSSMGIAISEQQQMAQVETALSHACRVRETFNRNNLLLRIITMSIRMEASRVDAENQSVFLNVAAAIAEIDGKIAKTTAAAFDRIEEVIAEARTERAALHSLEQNLQGRAQQSIDKLQQELTGYQSALAPCAELSAKVNKLLTQTGPLTLQIITSLQYQDIVRQQLEHVSSGFEDIANHLNELDRSAKSNSTPELGFIHHAACVQQAHLSASRDEIEKAGSTVANGISEMLGIGTQLIGCFTEMEKAAQNAFGRSRISELFKHEIHQLTLVADQSEKANQKISRLVDRIDELVRVFSHEISSHEFEVKVVSLNAQIAAARMSAANALNKLAEESSFVSNVNAAATDELTKELQGCLSQLQAIKYDADAFMSIVTEEKNALEINAADVSAKLAGLGTRIGDQSTSVRREFELVHKGQNQLLGRLRMNELVETSYGPAALVCESLRAATRAFALPEDLSAEGLRKLSAHQSRYTMERENEVHAHTLSNSAASITSSLAGAAADNIDLFDAVTPDQPETIQSVSTTSPIDTPTQSVPSQDSVPNKTKSTAPKEDLGDGIELF